MAKFFEQLRSSLGIASDEEDTEEEETEIGQDTADPEPSDGVRKKSPEKKRQTEPAAPKQQKQEPKKEKPAPKKIAQKVEVAEKSADRQEAPRDSETIIQKPMEMEKEDWTQSDGELAADVYQTEKEFVIQTAVAGVKAEDIDITAEKNTVSISGERTNTNTEQGKNYILQECYWGSFSKQIILPEEVDIGRVEATMEDGILTVRLPRLSAEKTKKIRVKSLEKNI